jgi:hypothetical protein
MNISSIFKKIVQKLILCDELYKNTQFEIIFSYFKISNRQSLTRKNRVSELIWPRPELLEPDPELHFSDLTHLLKMPSKFASPPLVPVS